MTFTMFLKNVKFYFFTVFKCKLLQTLGCSGVSVKSPKPESGSSGQ